MRGILALILLLICNIGYSLDRIVNTNPYIEIRLNHKIELNHVYMYNGTNTTYFDQWLFWQDSENYREPVVLYEHIMETNARKKYSKKELQTKEEAWRQQWMKDNAKPADWEGTPPRFLPEWIGSQVVKLEFKNGLYHARFTKGEVSFDIICDRFEETYTAFDPELENRNIIKVLDKIDYFTYENDHRYLQRLKRRAL